MENYSNDNRLFVSGCDRPIVWSIATSDSDGGAGIQADTLTIQDLGGHACNIITAVTAQNSYQVEGVSAVSPDMLTKQLNCLLYDMPPKVVKIGVLADAEQVLLVSHWLAVNLAAYEQTHDTKIPIIWDPVMFTTSGHALTSGEHQANVDAYLRLAKQVTLLTLSCNELMVLAGTFEGKGQSAQSTQSAQSAQSALDHLYQLVETNILVIGGDSQNLLVVDWLAAHKIAHTSEQHQHQHIGFSGSRVDTRHNHETGCTLSSAISTAMALGHPLLDAIVIAKAYVHQGLSDSYVLGKGPGVLARHGWPNDLANFPEIMLPQYPQLANVAQVNFANISLPLKVYSVTQSLSVLEQVLKAGARTAQLRIKLPCDNEQLERDIQQGVALGRQYQAQVFINDHWQLAIKYGAFGIHLGQEDMLQANLSQIADAGLALGLSSHGYFEMLLSQQLSPSYLAIGHIFATPTKLMPSQPQGLLKLLRYCQLLKDRLPLVAIGGIDEHNLAQVKATQVHDVAIVRGIELASDPAKSWKTLQLAWQALT
jgi:hydroxymethylpyrimidine kinase/phosphomethylpyrimidine kinase/thiamine-phosphate diphosphorylase